MIDSEKLEVYLNKKTLPMKRKSEYEKTILKRLKT